MIFRYTLMRVHEDLSFTFHLHLLYLINDFLHHCQRKSDSELRSLLGKYVVEMFVYAYSKAGEHASSREKLNKLLTLWERNIYFDNDTIQSLKEHERTLSLKEAARLEANGETVNAVASQIESTYQQYELQHNEFCRHVESQIAEVNAHAAATLGNSYGDHPNSATSSGIMQSMTSSMSHHVVSTASGDRMATNTPPVTTDSRPRRSRFDVGGPPRSQPSSDGAPIPSLLAQMQHMSPPDQSNWRMRPPPGFGGPPYTGRPPLLPLGGQPPFRPSMDEQSLIPTVAYYDLPAGLMCPLIKLAQCDYEPLDPGAMRLPAPMPPSERLLAAVEAFYSLPTHENPRDQEGWEKLGLQEYYAAKTQAQEDEEERHRRRRDDRRRNGVDRRRGRARTRSRSRSPSPLGGPAKSRQNSHRRAGSHSPSEPNRRRSGSPNDRTKDAPSGRKSPSPPPPRRRLRSRRSGSRSSSRSRSGSPGRGKRFARRRSRSLSRSRSRSRGRSRSSSRSRKSRSASGSPEIKVIQTSIKKHENRSRTPEDERGGLGNASEAPSTSADPFEQFRRQRSDRFIERMKEGARARKPAPPPKEEEG